MFMIALKKNYFEHFCYKILMVLLAIAKNSMKNLNALYTIFNVLFYKLKKQKKNYNSVLAKATKFLPDMTNMAYSQLQNIIKLLTVKIHTLRHKKKT